MRRYRKQLNIQFFLEIFIDICNSMTRRITTSGILAFLFCTLLLCSCGKRQENRRIRETLRNFENSTIIFPEQMKEFQHGAERMTTIPGGYRFVVYFAPGECSSCALNHMDLSQVLALGEELGFTSIAIISPDPKDLDRVRADLMFRLSAIPLYFDEDFCFRQKNTSIPKDPRFHFFLVNPQGKPIYVGNPSTPERRALLKRVMSESKE